MYGGTNRTVLYYPTIDLPRGAWLRQALLYWDNVASIVPSVKEGVIISHKPDELWFLLENKIFKPINPAKLSKEYELVIELEEEFKEIVESPEYRRFIGPNNTWIISSRIHVSKVSDRVIRYLQDKKLADIKIKKDNDGEWYLFETKTALLFMSLLARYVAGIEEEHTVPSTENEKYKDLIFNPRKNDVGMICTSALFKNILPVPSNTVTIENIINFRKDNRTELLRFRREVWEFQENISKAQNQIEIKDLTTGFAEKCQIGINEIIEALNENKIQFRLDSLQTLINSPTLVTAIASGALVIAGKIVGINIPLESSVIPPAITSSVEIGSHCIKSKITKSSLLRESAFSYLYHAESLT